MDIEKKSRGAKINDEQKKVLVDFLNENRSLVLAKLTHGLSNKKIQQQWESLSKDLNRLPGAKKDWRQWRKTWQDIRAKTKCKFSELKKLKMENGEGPSTIESLTELDKKILSLIYPSAVSQAMEVYGHADIEEPEIDIKFEELDEYDEDYNTPESLDEPFEPHIEPPIITLPIEVPIEPPPLAPIQKRLGSPTLNGTVDDNRTLKKYYYEEKLNLLREKNFIKQQKLEISRQKVKALEGIRDALQNRRK